MEDQVREEPPGRQRDMVCHRGGETQRGVRDEHEALLFVGLGGEDGEPETDGGREGEHARGELDRRVAAAEEVVEGEGRGGGEGEREEEVEVEGEVAEVEVPGLGAVDVGAFGRGEDVVEDDVEGDYGEFAVEEVVDADDGGLGG